MNCLAKNPTFINLKDHKEHFQAILPCLLINPSKRELVKVNKVKLEKINLALLKHLEVNQRKNSSLVIEWLKCFDNKKNSIFVKSNIREFHPSISESIFKKSILFAKEHDHIPHEDVTIRDHCRKSLLFHENESWKKKKTDCCFDLTMGSYGRAEICELVGIFILTHLATIMKKGDCRLYSDDGLVILRNVNGQQIDPTRKNIKTFKDVDLALT